MPRPDDLRPAADALKSLDWTPARRAQSLVNLYGYSLDQARNAIAWYDTKRGSKRFYAYLFRMTTLVATTLAGVVPTLAQLHGLQYADGKPLLDPLLSTVFVAVAGFALAADRFCGFTTGWVRYAQASLQIGNHLHQFSLNWQAAAAAAGVAAPAPVRAASPGDSDASGRAASNPPSDAFVRERIEACRALLTQIQQVIQGETDAWAAEFQKAVKAIDDSFDARRTEPRPPLPGAINITVSNADQCTGGWTLAIDGGDPIPSTGKLTARNSLTPGTHCLHAQGIIGGKSVAAQVAFEIEPGKVTAVNLLLS